MRWFRFYDEALDDPKVQRLSHESFHVWVNLLCVASRNSGHIPADRTDLAFSLRMQPARLESQIKILVAAGLLDEADTLRPHNWDNRQYESDSSAERMRRHRQRKRDGEVTSPVTSPVRNSDVPDTETEAETETEQKQKQTVTPPTLSGCHERYPEVCRAFLDLLGDKGVNAINLNRLDAILKAGADPDLDIYPTVKKMVGRWDSGSIKFFERAIMDSLASRTAPVAQGTAKSQFFNPQSVAEQMAKRATA